MSEDTFYSAGDFSAVDPSMILLYTRFEAQCEVREILFNEMLLKSFSLSRLIASPLTKSLFTPVG